MVQFQAPLILKFSKNIKITEKLIDEIIEQIMYRPTINPDVISWEAPCGDDYAPIGSVLELGKFQGKDKKFGILLKFEILDILAEPIESESIALQGILPYIIGELDPCTNELKHVKLRNLVLKVGN